MSIFSWCDELETWSEGQVGEYLARMVDLETANPDVRFVYMTANAQGENRTRHARNEQIRSHCRTYGRILYDFGDLDCWYGNERHAEGGVPVEHPAYNGDYEGTHANEESCRNKARAFWWMMARLAGWQGGVEPSAPPLALNAGTRLFDGAHDRITIYADVTPCAGFTPYVRFVSPAGGYHYLTNGGGIVPGGAGEGAPYLKGPRTVTSPLSNYRVASFEFDNVETGTYRLQGAFVGEAGIIGGLHSTDLEVE
ncbi:MAG: hypothetical protein IT574_03130 [Candidatus Aureabacteria bacterium]|nr:hypothetical protein [Candidatus Auribacterota bacterium]NLW94706.1 hypothetical protein [Chlamydiota bacterium]